MSRPPGQGDPFATTAESPGAPAMPERGGAFGSPTGWKKVNHVPKDVPKMSLPHISATNVSARARERVLVLGNSTIGDGMDMKIMKFEARRSSNTPVCCRHDQHLMDLPSRGSLVSHLLSPSRPSTTVPSTRHTFSSCKLMVLRTIRNYKRSETTMNNGKNSFLPINSLFTLHTDT